MADCILITGTDTGIGKTRISELILSTLVKRGHNVSALKLIETGCSLDKQNDDSRRLAKVLGLSSEQVSTVAGFRFKAAVAPLLVAEIEGKSISISALKERIAEAAKDKEILLVEGAGGLLVPITFLEENPENVTKDMFGNLYTFADLAKDCSLDVILIVGSRLGALNQALLTFEVLKQRKISVLGYVLNDFKETGPDKSDADALNTNRELLKRLSEGYGVRELGYVPYIRSKENGVEERAKATCQVVLDQINKICEAITSKMHFPCKV